MTTEAQGGSDMAAKIVSGPSRSPDHGNVRNAILEIGLSHGFETEFRVKALEILLGGQPDGVSRPLLVQCFEAPQHELPAKSRAPHPL